MNSSATRCAHPREKVGVAVVIDESRAPEQFIPAKAASGVSVLDPIVSIESAKPGSRKCVSFLDSGFRRNDDFMPVQSFPNGKEPRSMSMILSVAVLSEAVFKKLKADSSLADELFFGDCGALAVKESDIAECDYLALTEAQEAMAEFDGDGGEAELDFQSSGALDYDAGYGPVIFVAPEDGNVLRRDAWEMAAALNEQVAALLVRARKNKLYVVAVIS